MNIGSGHAAFAATMLFFSSAAAFAELPEVSNPFPQEEWGGFVLAVRFLGGYGAALPLVASEAAPDRCLSDGADERTHHRQLPALSWHQISHGPKSE